MSCPTPYVWRSMPDGSRTCSYCGSLHPADFIDIMHRYTNGEDGYHFDLTSKGYKVYANRPGVKNASEGGIKFYGWHIDAEHKDELDAIWHLATIRYAHEYEKRWGRWEMPA